MKARITYDDSVTVECEPSEIAEKLPNDATDDAIADALYEDIGDTASEREWPSFSVARSDIADLVAAVRAEIDKRRKPASKRRARP
mgnify:FL=1